MAGSLLRPMVALLSGCIGEALGTHISSLTSFQHTASWAKQDSAFADHKELIEQPQCTRLMKEMVAPCSLTFVPGGWWRGG